MESNIQENNNLAELCQRTIIEDKLHRLLFNKKVRIIEQGAVSAVMDASGNLLSTHRTYSASQIQNLQVIDKLINERINLIRTDYGFEPVKLEEQKYEERKV
jgi:hypothetical protein